MSTQQISIKDSEAASKTLLAQENIDGSITFYHAEDTNQRGALLMALASRASDMKLEEIRALLATTINVSTTSLPLPGGAATEAGLSTIRTALGSPLQAGGAVTVSSSALPTNAATSALQTMGNTSLASIATSVSSTLKTDTVVVNASTNKSVVVGTSAQTLMAANTARRGFVIQNQSTTATVYVNGLGGATADHNSLMIGPGGYYESQLHHIGTGAISIIASAASTPVYSREF
jgi:hypothetical protein